MISNTITTNKANELLLQNYYNKRYSSSTNLSDTSNRTDITYDYNEDGKQIKKNNLSKVKMERKERKDIYGNLIEKKAKKHKINIDPNIEIIEFDSVDQEK